MSFTIVEDLVTTKFVPVSVKLAKVALSSLETFEVIVCWSYGNYSNLANLCNDSTRHSVVNALGSCLTEFEVVVQGAKELQEKVWAYKLNEPPATKTVLELNPIVQVQYKTADLHCGEIALKLEKESQSEFLTLGNDGIL